MNRKKYLVRSALLALVLIAGADVRFYSEALAANYNDRPDILLMKSKMSPETRESIKHWEGVKEGLVEAVAEILGAYGEAQIYFIARDAEELYDTAKFLLTRTGNIKDLARVHLINVSREHIGGELTKKSDPNLVKYLAQEGISQEAVKKGTQFVFVDTGYKGTVPSAIKKEFRGVRDGQISTHLLVCNSGQLPSTRVFLFAFDPQVAKVGAEGFHNLIGDYEHMPRHFDRSNRYVEENGRWYPEVPENRQDTDGKVDPKLARKRMQDLRAYLDRPHTQEHFLERLAFWVQIGTEIKTNTSKGIETLLKRELASKNPRRESVVQDAFEIITRNFKQYPQAIPQLSNLEVTSAEPMPYVYVPSPKEEEAIARAMPLLLDLESEDAQKVKVAALHLAKELSTGAFAWPFSGKVEGELLHTHLNFPEMLAILIKPLESPPSGSEYSVGSLMAATKSEDPKVHLALVRGIANGNFYAEYVLNKLTVKNPQVFQELLNCLKSKDLNIRRSAGRVILEQDPAFSHFPVQHQHLESYLRYGLDEYPILERVSSEEFLQFYNSVK